jgi:hypothetical protein
MYQEDSLVLSRGSFGPRFLGNLLDHHRTLRDEVSARSVEACNLGSFCNQAEAEKYVCAVCHCVPRDAVATACQHVFCRGCLLEWTGRLEAEGRIETCPCCRRRLTSPQIPLESLGAAVNALRVRCELCVWTGPLLDRAAHMHVCPFARAACVCGFSAKRYKVHVHQDRCRTFQDMVWVTNAMCALCRTLLTAPCLSCRIGGRDAPCPLTSNVHCRHRYHRHCQNRRSVCFACDVAWISEARPLAIKN